MSVPTLIDCETPRKYFWDLDRFYNYFTHPDREVSLRAKKKLPLSFFLGSPLPGWTSMCPSTMSGSIHFAFHSINMSCCRNLTFSPIISISLLWNLAPQDCCAGRQGCGEDLHSSGDLKVLRITKESLLFLKQCEHFEHLPIQLFSWHISTFSTKRTKIFFRSCTTSAIKGERYKSWYFR